MFDARTFLNGLDRAKEVLKNNGADFKGEYTIHDIIYKSKNPEEGLNEVFLRLRLVRQNIWDEKPFIVAIKNTEIKKVGKQSIIPVKKQFDTREEAEKFLQENYLDKFEYDFEFDRVGWQYFIGKDGVDLEEIEGYYSIEFKSRVEENLQKLLDLFGVKDIITGSSVVKIKEILNR